MKLKIASEPSELVVSLSLERTSPTTISLVATPKEGPAKFLLDLSEDGVVRRVGCANVDGSSFEFDLSGRLVIRD